ncbi:hypothetical protein BUALT_Bualt04G0007600 [Buddleja alternifolia]|uniref:F-box associated beta-propeller type 1 domain-containing protein n=1 Tax=Buddleja alternifolia TaxID=168488 RepID=A0AAV6XK75_9LAMI|nr:hypothetical protein BUALT_Bualt04G0007600 [Buddleja alternifolia]
MAGEEYSSSDDWYYVLDDEGKNSSDESLSHYVEIGSLSLLDDDKSDKGKESNPESDLELMDDEESNSSYEGLLDDEASYSSDEGLLDDEEKSLSEESIYHYTEIGSSSSVSEDIFGKQLGHNFTSFPRFRKTNQQKEIKDIANLYILPLLPAKTLVRFRSVSKEWDFRIKSPLLAHEQSFSFKDLSGFFCQYNGKKPTFLTLNNLAYGVPTPSLAFLPGPVNIISSSNGLLLCKGNDDLYYICNPANEEWKALPKPAYYHGPEPATILAFEPSRLNMGANYQLICAVPLFDQPIVCFEIYSSGTQSWRVSNTMFVGELGFTRAGLYMKGMAYWETSRREVLAFDVKNNIHEIISIPRGAPLNGVLARIHDELCYIGVSTSWGDEYSIEIYGGVHLRLKHTINVNLEPGPDSDAIWRVLPCVDGEIVMILMGSLIYSYSLRSQRIETISLDGMDDVWAWANFLPYVNSLVHVA